MSSVLNEVLQVVGLGKEGLLRPWWDMLGLRIATLMGITTTVVLALDAVSTPPSCLPYRTYPNESTLVIDENSTFGFATAKYVERFCKVQQNVYNLYFGWVLLIYTLLVLTIQEVWYVLPIQKTKLNKFSQLLTVAKGMPLTKNEMLQIVTAGEPDREQLSVFYGFYRELTSFLGKMGKSNLLTNWYVFKLSLQIVVVITAFVLNFPGFIFVFQPEFLCDFSKGMGRKRMLITGPTYECINDLNYFNRHVLNLFEILLFVYIIFSIYGLIKSVLILVRFNKPKNVLGLKVNDDEVDDIKVIDIELKHINHNNDKNIEKEPLDVTEIRKRKKQFSKSKGFCKLDIDYRKYDPEIMKNDAAFLVCLFGLSNEHDSVKLTDILSLSFRDTAQNVVFSPTGVKPVHPTKSTEIAFQWKPPKAGRYTSFVVECDPPTSVCNIEDQTVPDAIVRSAIISGCTPGTIYKIGVRSKLNQKVSESEYALIVTEPAAPTFEARTIEKNSIEFLCKHPIGSFTHYNLVASKTSDREVVASFKVKGDIDSDTQVIKCKRLEPNTEYHFSLRVMLHIDDESDIPVNLNSTRCITSSYETIVLTTAS